MIHCEELNKLSEENSKLFQEFRGLEDELKMTSKNDPSYSEKAQRLKKARGRFSEGHRKFMQHIKDHGCR